MRWGLVGRPELGRGLGVLTRHIVEWARPDRVLSVVGCASGADHDSAPITHPDVVEADVDRLVGAWESFHDGLDFVVHLETPYDYGAFDAHRAAGVASALWVMPEHAPWLSDPNLPTPDVFLFPTSWRLDHWVDIYRRRIDETTGRLPYLHLAPVPCPPTPWRRRTEAARILHVAGQHARLDRNGTKTFAQAANLLADSFEITVVTQSPDALPRLHRRIKVAVDPPTLAPFYEWADVVVLPRRYGGLCLPALEAMAAGAVVVMPDIAPNDDWPIVPIPVDDVAFGDFVGGSIPVARVDPLAVGDAIVQLAKHPDAVSERSAAAIRYAARHNWRDHPDVFTGLLTRLLPNLA